MRLCRDLWTPTHLSKRSTLDASIGRSVAAVGTTFSTPRTPDARVAFLLAGALAFLTSCSASKSSNDARRAHIESDDKSSCSLLSVWSAALPNGSPLLLDLSTERVVHAVTDGLHLYGEWNRRNDVLLIVDRAAGSDVRQCQPGLIGEYALNWQATCKQLQLRVRRDDCPARARQLQGLSLSREDGTRAGLEEQSRRSHRESDVWRVPVVDGDPQVGPADAAVTAVLFGTAGDPLTHALLARLEALRGENPDSLRIVWKGYATSSVDRAANDVLKAVYRSGDSKAAFAHLRSLPLRKLDALTHEPLPIDPRLSQARVSDSTLLGLELKLDASPHVFLNGRLLSGPQPVSVLRQSFARARAEAEMLAAKGVAAANIYAEITRTARETRLPNHVGPRARPKQADDTPSLGNPDAPILVEVYGSFTDAYTSRLAPRLIALLRQHKNAVRLEWRNFYLASQDTAPLAAEAAYEVFRQQGNDGFWRYGQTLMRNWKHVSRSELERYAAEQGVDVRGLSRALDLRTHSARVSADRELAAASQVVGTPTLIVDGYVQPGAVEYHELEWLVRTALEKKLSPPEQAVATRRTL